MMNKKSYKDMTLLETEMLLRENIDACVENCGIHDEYNTTPAVNAYTNFRALLSHIEHIVELYREAEQLFADKAV